jgi:hypothetical protein
MTSRLESYRVQAYNTAKLSENKMHDDTVAQRFGFSGGLVPGVDVMAYMLHLPVRRWGRAFLEHGLIEARFVKPVYDGEIANVTAEEANGVLTIEVESRGQLCATGTASLPASAPSLSIADFSEIDAVTERRPVNATSYEPGKWLGTAPRAWAGDAATEYLHDVREHDPIYTREGLGHPRAVAAGDEQGAGRQCRFGTVDSRRQPHATPVGCEERRRVDGSGESHRKLREEGSPFRRTRRAGGRGRHDAVGALPAHRDLPAARTGSGLGLLKKARRTTPQHSQLVILRESGGSSTLRPHGSIATALEYWAPGQAGR